MNVTTEIALHAPLCETCWDCVDDPECRLVQVDGAWVHIGNDSARCPGQEDDDTDDCAKPWIRLGRYVIDVTDDGEPVHGRMAR